MSECPIQRPFEPLVLGQWHGPVPALHRSRTRGGQPTVAVSDLPGERFVWHWRPETASWWRRVRVLRLGGRSLPA